MFAIAPFANLGDLDEILQLAISDRHSTFRNCYVTFQLQFTPSKCCGPDVSSSLLATALSSR